MIPGMLYIENNRFELKQWIDEEMGNEKETRKLVVYEQEATVSTQLTNSLIKKLDVNWLKKTQNKAIDSEYHVYVEFK